LGALPVFVDSEMSSWNICPELLEIAIEEEIRKGKKPKVILVVHTYGMPADMDRIITLSKKYNIPVLEDAAAALGSVYKGKSCGTMGDIGVYSFNANKIISTGGGGALVSNTKKYIEKELYFSTQSKEKENFYLHKEIGYNYRMSNLTAAIGLAQIEKIDEKIRLRRAVFQQYHTKLALGNAIGFQLEAKYSKSNRWLTCILLHQEKCIVALRKEFEMNGMELGRLWNPLHCQPIFKNSRKYLNGTAEELFKKGVTLPTSLGLEAPFQESAVAIILDLDQTKHD
jgi:dTDP-4-amino-4,6-dideoxygalactose transaminase